MRSALAAALALLVACAPCAAQQDLAPNGVLLVARPGMPDPNFARTVVLVTRANEGHTVGVVLNRPTRARRDGQPLWFGGPVMPHSVVALFAAEAPPPAAAFHVLPRVYLTLHPQNVDALLAQPGARFRLYAGFSAWAPEQLEREIALDAWYVLPAEEAFLLRDDMGTLWEELVARAEGART